MGEEPGEVNGRFQNENIKTAKKVIRLLPSAAESPIIIMYYPKRKD